MWPKPFVDTDIQLQRVGYWDTVFYRKLNKTVSRLKLRKFMLSMLSAMFDPCALKAYLNLKLIKI